MMFLNYKLLFKNNFLSICKKLLIWYILMISVFVQKYLKVATHYVQTTYFKGKAISTSTV